MNLEARIIKLEAEVRRLHRERVAQVTAEKWVNASVITDLTGWDNEGMRRARRNSLVEYKVLTGKRGYLYNLTSLHPRLMKKAPAVTEAQS